MTSLLKSPLIVFIPVIIIICQLFFWLNFDLKSRITPNSPQNQFSEKLTSVFHTAGIDPLNLKFRDFRHEAEFSLKNISGTTFPVIFSTTKDPLSQVTALQKLLKKANIEGKAIRYIDLSVLTPYATF